MFSPLAAFEVLAVLASIFARFTNFSDESVNWPPVTTRRNDGWTQVL
jgi:hypothetical protein